MRRKKPRRALLLVALAFLPCCRSYVQPDIDLVLVSGKVFTADEARLWVQAIAIRGDRIVTVGSNASIRALAGPKTRVIDLGGRVVVPGLNDAHVHVPWSPSRIGIEIPDRASTDQILAPIAEAVTKHPEGAWLEGLMPVDLLDDVRLTRDALDAIAPQHRIVLRNFGFHTALLNTAALRAWNIGENDADPPGGHYGRSDGRLNGWLFEHALWTKDRAALAAEPDEVLIEKMRAFASEALRYGITTLAGSPLERGAAFSRPYNDRPAETGRVNYTDDQIRYIARVAARGEQPLLVHLAGDVPVGELFAAMSEIAADWPSRRVRVEQRSHRPARRPRKAPRRLPRVSIPFPRQSHGSAC